MQKIAAFQSRHARLGRLEHATAQAQLAKGVKRALALQFKKLRAEGSAARRAMQGRRVDKDFKFVFAVHARRQPQGRRRCGAPPHSTIPAGAGLARARGPPRAWPR